MKLLSNIWFLMILSAALFLGTSAYLYMGAAKKGPKLPETMHTKEVDGRAVAALWNTQTGEIENLQQELEKREGDLDLREGRIKQMEER